MRQWKRLFHLGGADDVVDWEIQHHLEERADQLMATRAIDRATAMREARRAFGDIQRVRAEMQVETRGRARRVQLAAAVRDIGQDVRLAMRRLRRQPVFALVAVLVLGLGIGANTAVYTVLDAALLQRPPYPEPERIVMIDLVSVGAPDAPMPWSYPKFDVARERLRSIEQIAGYSAATLTLTGAGDARRLGIEYVSPSYFELLGVDVMRGRAFGAAEERIGDGGVVLLGEGLWRSGFGADPEIIGRTITLDGAALEVIGVVPSRFRGLSGSADAWVPFAGIATIRGPRRLELPRAHWLYVVARLRDDVTLAQARTDAGMATQALRETFPPAGDWDPSEIGVAPMLEARVNPVSRLAVGAVSLGAGLLLLIAFANVSGLLLVRASARRSELAVRAALGAARWRLVRESLVESLLLALAGGALGLLLALAGQRFVVSGVRFALETTGTRGLQFLDPAALTIDGSIVLAGFAAALIMGLAFGLVPGIGAARGSVSDALHGAGRGAVRGPGARSGFGRAVLVAGQLALTLVLLCGAALMGASLTRLSSVAVGFTHREVLVLSFDRGVRPTPLADAAFEEALLERIAALPGVRSAAVAPCAPLTGPCEITGISRIDGVPLVQGSDGGSAITYAVSDAYFRTLGIPLVEGESFGAAHASGMPPAVVISESAARMWFPGRSALGHRIELTHELTAREPAVVIGVVADVPYDTPESPMRAAVYLSRRQAPSSYGTLFVHTAGDAHLVLDEVRREVAAIDPDAPLFRITTLGELERAATGRTRVILALLASFGALGLLLSITGLYGVVSYAVIARTREMGVRIALGASARDVLRLVLRTPVILVLLGAVAGLAAAFALTRYVRDLLYGVSAADPRVLGAAALGMLLVALIAALVPARRAVRVDPAAALRSD